ncbi:MAG: hypothetical protein EBS30_14920 [Planctomycetes bacterium]|nr:hypothetical protein [Planctomycetota bacterium]
MARTKRTDAQQAAEKSYHERMRAAGGRFITFRLDEAAIAAFDAVCLKTGRNRAEQLRWWIEQEKDK